MSSHETRVWDTPGEEHLASLMNNASELLVPNDSYSLELKLFGVKPDDDTYIEIGDRYQAKLNERALSNLRFSFDSDARKLQLEQFEFPLPGDAGYLELNRIMPGDIPPYDFIPSVTILNQKHEAKAPAWNPRWQNNLEQRLTQGHGLDIAIPQNAPDTYYHLWLGHEVLSKCDSWWLSEKTEIGYQTMGKFATKVSIMRAQDVRQNTLVSTETVSIVYETTHLESTNAHSVTKRLDLVSNQDQQRFIRKTFKKSTGNSRTNRDAKKSPSRGAEAKDISYFTDVVQRALDTAKPAQP